MVNLDTDTTSEKLSLRILLPALLPVLLCWAFLCIYLIAKSPDEYSESERRKLAAFPELTYASFQTGNYAGLLEGYLKDQFPLRDDFRSLAGFCTHNLYRRDENNGYLLRDDHIVLLNYPLNESSLEHAADHFTGIYDTYLANTDCNVFFCIIPEKNQYLLQQEAEPVISYETTTEYFTDALPFATFIGIDDILSADNYYATDTHWRQETLLPVAQRILSVLSENASFTYSPNYTPAVALTDFRGVLSSGGGYFNMSESLSYFDSPNFSAVTVTHAEPDKTTAIYDEDELFGPDPYSYFLSGPSALITIENPNAASDKELILFRDSFGSAIAPLFLEEYARITLVDTRYIRSAFLGEYITFDNQDILFLYSTMLLNESATLK